MKRHVLTVEKRAVLGKKVKKLRREGLLPANIYGKDVKSLAVEVKLKEFKEVFNKVGETGLVDLKVNGEVRPVLIHNVQIAPLTHQSLHADFYQVNLKEKVKATVPVVAVGEAKAVSDKVGILLQPLAEVEVEALPTELPENIEVNVSNLAALDEQILVRDIKVPAGVEVLTDPEQVVVKIAELVTKEAEEQAAAEAAAAEAAKAAAEPAPEGEAPAEEEKPAEEAPNEEAPLRSAKGSEGQVKPEEKPQ